MYRLNGYTIYRYFSPPDSYESKHRWDPKATWTEEEERKLRRKLGKRPLVEFYLTCSEAHYPSHTLARTDFKVAFVACICFAALQLDRGNVSHPSELRLQFFDVYLAHRIEYHSRASDFKRALRQLYQGYRNDDK
jgi:hypothetical protein